MYVNINKYMIWYEAVNAVHFCILLKNKHNISITFYYLYQDESMILYN
jgi:hypothetical protein